jgi:hypothetical protein
MAGIEKVAFRPSSKAPRVSRLEARYFCSVHV